MGLREGGTGTFLDEYGTSICPCLHSQNCMHTTLTSYKSVAKWESQFLNWSHHGHLDAGCFPYLCRKVPVGFGNCVFHLLILFQMCSVVLFHLILAFCAVSSWSFVPDYSIPLSSGSQTVEIHVPVSCSTSLPSEVLQCRFEFGENWECIWFVNKAQNINSPFVISRTETSIDVNVTTAHSGPIVVECLIKQNGDVISIEIKKCI